jgi:hypothetical protein
MGHASRSSGLLHVKASRASVSQSGLKTSRGTTTGAARGIITEVATGYVRSCYFCFAIFVLLDPMSIIVF